MNKIYLFEYEFTNAKSVFQNKTIFIAKDEETKEDITKKFTSRFPHVDLKTVTVSDFKEDMIDIYYLANLN